jgi:hypothetical protein
VNAPHVPFGVECPRVRGQTIWACNACARDPDILAQTFPVLAQPPAKLAAPGFEQVRAHVQAMRL